MKGIFQIRLYGLCVAMPEDSFGAIESVSEIKLHTSVKKSSAKKSLGIGCFTGELAI